MTLSEYFSRGALVQILRRNSREPLGTWILKDEIGEFCQTNAAENDGLGGHPVPFGALENGKIFKPMVGEVITYLQTFGLSRQEAEYVVHQIGIHPPEIQIPNP